MKSLIALCTKRSSLDLESHRPVAFFDMKRAYRPSLDSQEARHSMLVGSSLGNQSCRFILLSDDCSCVDERSYYAILAPTAAASQIDCQVETLFHLASKSEDYLSNSPGRSH